ncbi:MAG: hypothetical protein HYY17_12905 [Planctomycetes bacterium]|nr:hypothetical protein [Planctomycetota bacterium]
MPSSIVIRGTVLRIYGSSHEPIWVTVESDQPRYVHVLPCDEGGNFERLVPAGRSYFVTAHSYESLDREGWVRHRIGRAEVAGEADAQLHIFLTDQEEFEDRT